MEYNFFIDESCHLENDGSSAMCIGYIKVPETMKEQYKEEIKKRMISYYPHIKEMQVSRIRNGYGIDSFGKFISCQGSVPEAIVCFLESDSFEDAVRNAVSLGGDADTQAAIAGSIAEAYYGISYEMKDKMMSYLTDNLRSICYAFETVRKKRIQREP